VLTDAVVDRLGGTELHELADQLQIALDAIHDRVVETYVRPVAVPS
jgi:hypothetical protein